jgi:hypothetical protein
MYYLRCSLNPYMMTTKIILSPSKKTYDVWYSNDGKTFVIHKRGFKSIDDAIKETTIINGSFKLLKDVLQNK